MKIEVELPEVYATELAKRDRKIAQLEKQLKVAVNRNTELETIFKGLHVVKDAILESADTLDHYRWND